MASSVQPPWSETDLRPKGLRSRILRAKAYSPGLRELAAPLRYSRNRRLVERLRDEQYTMLGMRRGRDLLEFARRVDREGIPGAIVDCGVWNGGSSILFGTGAPTRRVWAFDSFEGLPKPGPRDPDAHEDWEGRVRGSEEMLEQGFARFAKDPGRLNVVKGWFEDTLPAAAAEVGTIAILHIDADWYDSVMIALDSFYEQVAPGGYVVIDDIKAWEGARGATEDFRERHGIEAPLDSSHYWRRP